MSGASSLREPWNAGGTDKVLVYALWDQLKGIFEGYAARNHEHISSTNESYEFHK
jgi:hypothetical protein